VLFVKRKASTCSCVAASTKTEIFETATHPTRNTNKPINRTCAWQQNNTNIKKILKHLQQKSRTAVFSAHNWYTQSWPIRPKYIARVTIKKIKVMAKAKQSQIHEVRQNAAI
jgi:hypothetical protein